MRLFCGIQLEPELPKPPVIASKDITLSEDELAILSKGPKLTIRLTLNKQIYMVETEKALIKEKYSRIGKEKRVV